ncbi:hypothetical protein [Pseudomonas aeruginosa]|uniref:hypothetical protein n=1 Tax=Pseudomonas aeruginosa TaxID=287 RepID=UPI002A6AEC4F|nr:hypothetical protein [Pseudomonas aeruginosa]MDY1103270.1 hypothetical protein [Pseudomonas aeruginosa]
MILPWLRRMFGRKAQAPALFLGSTTSGPMTDSQLREWALRLHATSIAPAKLSGFGIDPALLLKAQLDDQALMDVRRWSGIAHPDQNT